MQYSMRPLISSAWGGESGCREAQPFHTLEETDLDQMDRQGLRLGEADDEVSIIYTRKEGGDQGRHPSA